MERVKPAHSDESTARRCQFVRAAPAPISQYVRGIEGYSESRVQPSVRHKEPTSIVPLIFALRDGMSLYDAAGRNPSRALNRSFVAGVQNQVTTVGFNGSVACLQVDLTPIGARRLLRIDMSELFGRVVDMRSIIGRDADDLQEQLIDASDWSKKFAIVETFLLRRMADAPTERPLTARAFATIQKFQGQVSIGELVKDIGCSRKHLAQVFEREIGTSPKSYARIVRFETALSRYRSGEIDSICDLAAVSGYADQAHFTRDCQAFTGKSPSDLFATL